MGVVAYDRRGKPEIRTIEHLRSVLRDAGVQHYVYVLCFPTASPHAAPFYVGVGERARLFAHENEARGSTATGAKVDAIRRIWRAGGEVLRIIDSFHSTRPWRREEELINRFGLIRDGTGVLTNENQYAPSSLCEGAELRKYAGAGNALPHNFHHRHTRLAAGPNCPRNPRSVFGKIHAVLRGHPGITGEELVQLLMSVDFSDNPSAYTQTGQVSRPWLAKYVDGGFYRKNLCIQEWVAPTKDETRTDG